VDRPVLLVLTLVVIPIIITLITGFFVLLGPLFLYYGFLLPWRLDYCPILGVRYGCPPIYWWAFVIDVLFYTALEAGLLLVYAMYRAPDNWPHHDCQVAL
jgi:hypothetical protein